jgi:hypothetical protein
MQEQAGNLVDAVSVFRLDAGAQAIRVAPALAPEVRARPLASPRKTPAITSIAPRALARGSTGEWAEF